MADKRSGLHIYQSGHVEYSNPCHNPAGPGGGQFCDTGGGAGSGGTGSRKEWVKSKTLSQNMLSDFGIKGIISKDHNLTLKKANAIGEHMTEVFNVRPGLGDFVSKMAPVKLSVTTFDNVGRGLQGSYTANTIVIGGKFTKSGSLGLGSKRFSTDDGAMGLFRHEFGHAVYDRLGDQAKKEWNTKWVINGMSQGFEKTVSRYAGTNDKEAFAESFAAWSHPKYLSSKAKLSGSIESYFNKTFGDKS